MGRNPDSHLPIIKVFLNPLICWIWIGVMIVVLGTAFALVPNATLKRREAPVAATVPLVAEVSHV